MAAYHRLTIAGAIDEMACEGTGCNGCPFAITPSEDGACSAEIPDEPQSLVRHTLQQAGKDVPAHPNLGHDADTGRVYKTDELGQMCELLTNALAVLPNDDELFNERQGIELALKVFTTAQAHNKRVVYEV
jgi:hypothetical protein